MVLAKVEAGAAASVADVRAVEAAEDVVLDAEAVVVVVADAVLVAAVDVAPAAAVVVIAVGVNRFFKTKWLRLFPPEPFLCSRLFLMATAGRSCPQRLLL